MTDPTPAPLPATNARSALANMTILLGALIAIAGAIWGYLITDALITLLVVPQGLGLIMFVTESPTQSPRRRWFRTGGRLCILLLIWGFMVDHLLGYHTLGIGMRFVAFSVWLGVPFFLSDEPQARLPTS
jgi:hypothetical protein